LFGRMMVMMMMTTCGCFTDNNYRPQLGEYDDPRRKMHSEEEFVFFLLDTRRKYLFGWQELQSKIHSTWKIYSTCPTPHLSNICLVHFTAPPSYMTKKIHSKIWWTLLKESWCFLD
jgi:hypothetical protein